MADYSNAELLNEVSKVFRASLNPGKEGGTFNTFIEYQQLLEMTSVTFLFNPDSIFYIARLAANQLNSILVQEVAILEDMLVALDDLGQIGSPIRDTTTLSNARTSILSLDAAESVTNRPESQRFARQMDTFAAQLRKNLVSLEKDGAFVRPREEARNLIQANLVKLSALHAQLLDQIFSLRDALVEFLSLDLPSKVSTTALSSVSSRLQANIDEISTNTDTENVAASRRLFLETLANKVSVEILSTFTDPTEFKYRSPNRPIPSTLKHYGRVTGQGTPASVTTNAGPWVLPVSAPLVLSVSGGAPITLNLDTIKGAVLNARNSQAYEITSDKMDLHVTVDPQVWNSTIIYGGTNWLGTPWVSGSDFIRLGFKHLGALILLPDVDTGIDPNDIHLRYITEMGELQTISAGNWTLSGSTLSASAFNASGEGAIGFQPGHVGAYIEDSWGQVFEVIQVISVTQCVLDLRGMTLPAGLLKLRGTYSSGIGSTFLGFQPNLTTAVAPGDRVVIGPSVKTARLSAGTRSAANIISDIQAEVGVFDAGHVGAPLNWHISPELVSGDSTRICLRIRSKLNPFVQITGRFTRPRNPVGFAAIDEGSAHAIFGYREGETDTTSLLTPGELVDLVGAQSGLTAEVLTTTLNEGTLETSATTSQVIDTSANFTALGVAANDQIEILDGVAAGTYRILSVLSATTLSVDIPVFIAKESSTYRIFREQVQIAITSAGPNSYLTVVSAPSELGLTAGTVYSAIPSFEAVDKLGNKLSFTGVLPGDFLRVVGQDEVVISDVQDTLLTLETGLQSTFTKVGFEIQSASARAFNTFNASLTTFTNSRNLLKKNNFDEDVSAIDNACTSAILPGQNFLSSRNQAKRMVSDLLSILTSTLLRSDEYSATVTINPNNLSDLLDTYGAAAIEVVDNILEAFSDRKYDRAATLLRACKFVDFYGTNEETGSFSGAVMNASRLVVKDLPNVSNTRHDFLAQRDIATSTLESTDAEEDFSDTDDQPEDLDL